MKTALSTFLFVLLSVFNSDDAWCSRIVVVGDQDAAAYVNFVRSEGAALQSEIYSQLGLAVKGDTRIAVSRDAEAMLVRAAREQGSTPPEWAAGLAYPSKRAIYMHASMPIDEFEVTLRHELSHVAFGQLRAGAHAPRWFVEGLAVWQSEGFDLGRAWLLTEAATMGTLYPLSALDRGFPSNGVRAGVAYAQAVHFIGYIHARFGADRFSKLIAALQPGDAEFADVVLAVFDIPLGALERDWRSRLRVRWGWLGALFTENTVWVLAAMLLILGWMRRRRERHTRLEQMRRLEEGQAPDNLEPRPPPPMMDPYDGDPPTVH